MTNAFAMELLVFFVLIAYFIVVRMTLSVERPAPAQHLAEMTHEFVSEQGEQIIGHGYERFRQLSDGARTVHSAGQSDGV